MLFHVDNALKRRYNRAVEFAQFAAPVRVEDTASLEGMCATSDRTLVVTPTPNCVYPQSGYAAGGISISTIDIGELRKMANGTTPGVSQGDRIRLRPVGTTWIPDEPGMPGNPDTTPNRASEQEACTHAPGKKPAASLLSRIFGASPRSGVWVNVSDLPR